MKVRYVIEHGSDEDVRRGQPFGLGEVDAEGEYVAGGPSMYASIEEAKAEGERNEPECRTWKPAPKDWQPDTILVSNYWNDEGWDNRG